MDSIKNQEGAGSKQGKSVKTRREYVYDGRKIRKFKRTKFICVTND